MKLRSRLGHSNLFLVLFVCTCSLVIVLYGSSAAFVLSEHLFQRPSSQALEDPLCKLHCKINHTHCVIYDRQPRTGSTTISSALRDCLSSRGYLQPATRGSPMTLYATALSTMLILPADRVALADGHLFLSETHFQAIEAHCQQWVYISSTASISERLWSIAKYRTFTSHGSHTLTQEQVRRAKLLFNDTALLRKEESYLNAYPYVSHDLQPLNVEENQRRDPHYVITKDHLEKDLGDLLEAFGCNRTYMTSNHNVHSLPATTPPRTVAAIRPKNATRSAANATIVTSSTNATTTNFNSTNVGSNSTFVSKENGTVIQTTADGNDSAPNSTHTTSSALKVNTTTRTSVKTINATSDSNAATTRTLALDLTDSLPDFGVLNDVRHKKLSEIGPRKSGLERVRRMNEVIESDNRDI